jgi:lauroyl/myristoyl acyltransferase
MSLLSVASNPRTMQAAMFLSRHIPERLGSRLFWMLAGFVAWTRPAPFRIERANLEHVLGPGANPKLVNRAARHAIYMVLRGYYDLFRTIQLPREQRASAVYFPQESQDVIHTLNSTERGSLLVFPHLGNFDIGGQAAATYIPDIQVITLPDPSPGFELTNDLRRQSGATVTPLSPAALRQAIRSLRHGGVVSIAGDRPVSDMDEPFPFFGSPARVPSGHVRLALQTNSVIVITYCILLPETHRYTMYFEPPLEMIRTGNHEEEVALNMRRVLDPLERAIRRWPEQWQMFVPVWPKLLTSVSPEIEAA